MKWKMENGKENYFDGKKVGKMTNKVLWICKRKIYVIKFTKGQLKSINNTLIVNWSEDVAVVNDDTAVINCYALVVNVDDVMVKY